MNKPPYQLVGPLEVRWGNYLRKCRARGGQLCELRGMGTGKCSMAGTGGGSGSLKSSPSVLVHRATRPQCQNPPVLCFVW